MKSNQFDAILGSFSESRRERPRAKARGMDFRNEVTQEYSLEGGRTLTISGPSRRRRSARMWAMTLAVCGVVLVGVSVDLAARSVPTIQVNLPKEAARATMTPATAPTVAAAAAEHRPAVAPLKTPAVAAPISNVSGVVKGERSTRVNEVQAEGTDVVVAGESQSELRRLNEAIKKLDSITTRFPGEAELRNYDATLQRLSTLPGTLKDTNVEVGALSKDIHELHGLATELRGLHENLIKQVGAINEALDTTDLRVHDADSAKARLEKSNGTEQVSK